MTYGPSGGVKCMVRVLLYLSSMSHLAVQPTPIPSTLNDSILSSDWSSWCHKNPYQEVGLGIKCNDRGLGTTELCCFDHIASRCVVGQCTLVVSPETGHREESIRGRSLNPLITMMTLPRNPYAVQDTCFCVILKKYRLV